MADLKLVLLGFGNAGRAFAKMLCEKQNDIRQQYGRGVIVTAISTGSRGAVVNSRGIDLLKACNDIETAGAFSKDTEGLCDCDPFEIIQTADCDVVCELTPLNIRTGQPAINHIREAFSRGKHVITANKGPIAWAYRELADIAKEKNLKFLYETTVMDGTPVFNLYQKTLKLCKLKEVSGILNSTTNFMLEEMADGKAYDEIIEEGRRLGFIEADPAMDIEGYDAAAKITALLNVLMDADITPDDVVTTGIQDITVSDIAQALSEDKVIKLLCKGVRHDDGSLEVFVKPVKVDRTDILATVDSTTSIVTFVTDLMGTVSVVEHRPEIEQTAYGIFSDMLRILDEA